MPPNIDALRILIYPDPRLRQACKPVERFDDELTHLIARMFELMRAEEGIGLAAPQVGVASRLFVCNVTGDPKDDMVFVNPRLDALEGQIEAEEGCLSIPEVRGVIRRAARCRIFAQDAAGRPLERTGEELSARCWQHECDHLDGRLIIDRMSDADQIANRKPLRELESRYKRAVRVY